MNQAIPSKILFVCKGHGNIAGAQLYLKQVCTLFEDPRFDLHFALLKNDGLRVFEEIGKRCQVSLWDYDWRHLSPEASYQEGHDLFCQVQPDLVVFNSAEDVILPAVKAAKKCGVPGRVMVVHWAQGGAGMSLFGRKAGIPYPSRYAWVTRVRRGLAFRDLTKLIFVNKGTREAYVSLYKLPRERCQTIYNGVDVDKIGKHGESRNRTRNELGLKPEDCLVFAAGNLTEVKGFKMLIEAMGIVTQSSKMVHCMIAGQGELQGKLQGQIDSLGLGNRVKLLGYRDDVPSLLAASDIFCMPSLNEALGYSLLEALAAGKPVVASAVGGIPEVVTPGREGLLIPPGDAKSLADALEFLVSQAPMRENMGKAGVATAHERFSITRMLTDTRATLLSGYDGPGQSRNQLEEP